MKNSTLSFLLSIAVQVKVKPLVAGEPQEDVKGDWKVCSPETVADFSAVAYFLLLRLDQGLLAKFHGAAEVGVYSVAVHLGEMLWLLPGALTPLLVHSSAADSGDPDRNRTAVRAVALGVAVTLVLPEKNDSRLVDYASRAVFDDLLAAGVRIAAFRGRRRSVVIALAASGQQCSRRQCQQSRSHQSPSTTTRSRPDDFAPTKTCRVSSAAWPRTRRGSARSRGTPTTSGRESCGS